MSGGLDPNGGGPPIAPGIGPAGPAPSGSAGDIVTLASSGVAQASSPAATRTLLGLGAAAQLAVGTAAGTVAAGDDARITGAVQTSRTIAGLSLAADRTAAEVRTAVVPTTYYDLSSSSGWSTHAGTIAGQTAAVTGGVGHLTCAANTSNSSNPITPTRASIYRAIPSTVDATRFRVVWRVAAINGGGLYLFLQGTAADYTATAAPSVYAGCSTAGAVDVGYAPAGATITNNSDTADGTLPTDGTGWMMVENGGADVTVYAGTGTSTAPPAPAAWRLAKRIDLTATAHVPGTADSTAQVVFTVLRWTITAANSAGAKSVDFDDVYVSPLSAPLPGS